jgi:hypothetical protein
MKKLVTIVSVLFYAQVIFGQAPEKTSYRAVIKNKEGLAVSNKEIAIRISIYKGGSLRQSGEKVYQEIHKLETNSKGKVNLELGKGEVVLGKFAEINWTNNRFYLQTEIDLEGGNNYDNSATTQVLNVPYVLIGMREKNDKGSYSVLDTPVDASVTAYNSVK